MTKQSRYLLQLAQKIIVPYTHLPSIQAAMVTGSAAKGLSDHYSDLDLTVYYEGSLPNDETLLQIVHEHGARERKWTMGALDSDWFAEAYDVAGIEVQIGHTTVAGWEKNIAKVQKELDCNSPLQKAMEGTLACLALYGETTIQRWKEIIADYPSNLAEAMVKKHLAFFPLWGLEAYLQDRDATLWLYETLVEVTQNIFGILAGLNRLYFTTFQFKRMNAFVAQMKIAPPNLAQRIDSLFQVKPVDLNDLETLVAETITLVEMHMPSVDTALAKRRLGWRFQPWQLEH